MAADDAPAFPGSLTGAPRNPISRRQIEVTLARSVASFGALFGLLAIDSLLEQLGQLRPAWAWVFLPVVFGGFLAALVASFARRWTVAANSFIALSWFLAMVTWPLGAVDVAGRPWLWDVLTVATSAAAIAWPVWAATVALVVLPVTYGVVRTTPVGGGSEIDFAVFDVVYAILLGGAVLILITLLRQAAASVDQAQATALDRYANAVRQHATEVERVQVDSIVHDSVLTTLLAAARADTPQAQRLAAQMARNAMKYLQEAETSIPDDDGTFSVRELSARIHASSAEVGERFVIGNGLISDIEIPVHSAEAVYSAAVQAMVNSSQHAGTGRDVRRWLDTRVTADGVFTVEVGDDGAGFERSSIPTARLGLRISIVERVVNAGGHVDIQSSPGNGTVITISWPCTGGVDHAHDRGVVAAAAEEDAGVL